MKPWMMIGLVAMVAALAGCASPSLPLSAYRGDPFRSAQNAGERLCSVNVFAFGGIGVAGVMSDGEGAYRYIWTCPEASAIFTSVLEEGTPAAKLYALCGLRTLEPDLFSQHARKLSKENPVVTTLQGCIGDHKKAATIVRRIRRGRYE